MSKKELEEMKKKLIAKTGQYHENKEKKYDEPPTISCCGCNRKFPDERTLGLHQSKFHNFPTKASAPLSVANGMRNLLAVAAVTKITFKEAEKMKKMLADPNNAPATTN